MANHIGAFRKIDADLPKAVDPAIYDKEGRTFEQTDFSKYSQRVFEIVKSARIQKPLSHKSELSKKV